MKIKKGRISNKIALVTGGADGIGFAISKVLHEEGAYIIIADINKDKGILASKLLKNSIFIEIDVSKEASWEETFKFIRKKFKNIDILVNNAGVIGCDKQDPENTSIEDWRKIHSINLDSVFLGCKYGIKLMKEVGGSIINMSSRSGIVGVPYAVAYASTKAAIRNYTKSVALYCATKGYQIRCNSVHPASIMTAMWKSMLGDGKTLKKNLKKYTGDIPMGRFGTPEEVAKAVLFLASDESSYTTGSEILIDGGTLAGSMTSPNTNKKI